MALSATDLPEPVVPAIRDRKSTRLNSSHSQISYAVFCLKKKNTTYTSINCAKSVMSTITIVVLTTELIEHPARLIIAAKWYIALRDCATLLPCSSYPECG